MANMESFGQASSEQSDDVGTIESFGQALSEQPDDVVTMTLGQITQKIQNLLKGILEESEPLCKQVISISNGMNDYRLHGEEGAGVSGALSADEPRIPTKEAFISFVKQYSLKKVKINRDLHTADHYIAQLRGVIDKQKKGEVKSQLEQLYDNQVTIRTMLEKNLATTDDSVVSFCSFYDVSQEQIELDAIEPPSSEDNPSSGRGCKPGKCVIL